MFWNDETESFVRRQPSQKEEAVNKFYETDNDLLQNNESLEDDPANNIYENND